MGNQNTRVFKVILHPDQENVLIVNNKSKDTNEKLFNILNNAFDRYTSGKLTFETFTTNGPIVFSKLKENKECKENDLSNFTAPVVWIIYPYNFDDNDMIEKYQNKKLQKIASQIIVPNEPQVLEKRLNNFDLEMLVVSDANLGLSTPDEEKIKMIRNALPQEYKLVNITNQTSSQKKDQGLNAIKELIEKYKYDAKTFESFKETILKLINSTK